MTVRRILLILSICALAGLADGLVGPSAQPALANQPLANGDFETGTLAGWTDMSTGGLVAVVREGTCFSFNDTTGLTLPGEFAMNVRSNVPGDPTSEGISRSDPFLAGGGISFLALSERRDDTLVADPVSFEVRLLRADGALIRTIPVATNQVATSPGCPSEARNGTFSAHSIDTSDLVGQKIRVEFRQHVNAPPHGFFTLVDEVQVVAGSIGDTHLYTFHGLFYDFQASGDFVLAKVDPDFVVQARQVSGAPRWPDASVNSAVATRMGTSEVALCLGPTRLYVDGTNTALGDAEHLSTPGGVDITRRGNVYFITSPSGDTVRAKAYPNRIDVFVAFGQWPATVRGLLANADNNVNKIASYDGTVFTKPFSFDDLYQRYGESWRVAPNESLLSVCGTQNVERGNPGRPFYARDLDPTTYQNARAICVAAGVKGAAFLDACTLDVAVLGDDTAAQVFVALPQPVAVGNPVTTPASVGGLSLDPAVGALPLQAQPSSGSDAWLLEALAGGMAVVVVAGGGVWYARRRRVR